MVAGVVNDIDLPTRVWLARLVARISLSCVWMYEGLVPKLLCVRSSEVDLVHRSGLYLADPRLTLNALGVAELLFGVWLLTGRAERPTAALAGAGIIILGTLVAIYQPESLADPFGGISKNLGLLGCASVCWLLAPVVPAGEHSKGQRCE